MEDLIADPPLPLVLCGSTDMDRLTRFPASDVDGVFMVDVRVIVVHIPLFCLLHSYNGLPYRASREFDR